MVVVVVVVAAAAAAGIRRPYGDALALSGRGQVLSVSLGVGANQARARFGDVM